MSLIKPFKGLRPKANCASNVVAPPYDVLNTEEARERAQGKPDSFLHISKPEIDLPVGTDPYSQQVYDKGLSNLQRLVSEEILFREDKDCYYVYRLIMGEHEQTGLVAVASVADYDTNRIRKHEFTRPDKENDRVKQIDTLNAQTGPVFLTYRHNPVIDELVKSISAKQPEYDLVADDGVKHTIWLINEAVDIELITSTFDAMNCLYIADGHHRSAAASRVAEKRKAANSDHTGEESYNYFLSVIFPDNQMKILDYNRVVSDLNGLTASDLLSAIEKNFSVTRSDQAVKPSQAGEFGMYMDKQWYKLNVKPDLIPSDPVGQLDVSLLHNNLIEPMLGISDPRTDKRVDFVGGIRGLKELEKRVDSGDMQLAFSLYATSLDNLMAVADAGEVMPPKSTWFEPKLADGLVSHVLD